jgi:restriction system protein
MLPLLKSLADGEEHKFSELVTQLGSQLNLNEDELSKLLPSGTQEIFTNRVGWARLYLKKAGLLDAPKRGFLQITERGRSILSENHERIDAKFLVRFPEFVAFKQRDSSVTTEPSVLQEVWLSDASPLNAEKDVPPPGTPSRVMKHFDP